MNNSLEPPKSIETPRPRRMGGLVAWLVLVPIVFGTLIGFSELAMVLDLEELAADTQSLLEAVYEPWPYDEIPPINVAALIEDIQKELELLGTPVVNATVQEGVFWVPGTATDESPGETPLPGGQPTPIPSATEDLPDIATATPQTQTVTATRTRTPATFTNTPTITRTLLQRTITASPTNTPTRTPTRYIPPVATTRVPDQPSTKTFVPSITMEVEPTAASQVLPIAENLGESSPNPDGEGCLALFGYDNENLQEIEIQAGDRNRLSLNDVVILDTNGSSITLPTFFEMGRISPAFGVIWNIEGPITWFLDGSEATVNWCTP